MEHNELKPCPFCGGEAVLRNETEMVGFGSCDDIYFVKCVICEAQGSKFGVWAGKNRKEKAIEAWNRRANDGKN